MCLKIITKNKIVSHNNISMGGNMGAEGRQNWQHCSLAWVFAGFGNIVI